MPITESQRVERAKRVYASDVPALFGYSPWGTITDVWYEKLGLVEPREATPAMDWGNRIEPVILDAAAEQLGKRIIKGGHRVYDDHLGAHCDATFIDSKEPLEAKFVGWVHSDDPLYQWGEPGTDQVPINVFLQVQTQIASCKVGKGYVAAAKGPNGVDLYVIPRDQTTIDAIAEEARKFMIENVLKQIEPEPMPSLDILKRMRREPGTWADNVCLTDVEEWERLSDLATQSAKDASAAKEKVLEQIGRAEGANLEDGRQLTYFLQNSAPSFRVKEFKQSHPELADEYVRQGQHRVLRVRKRKP